MEKRWSWLTALTAFMALSFVLNVVNLLWLRSLSALLLFGVSTLFIYWIVGGCARQGEPLARWLLRR